MRVHIGSYTKHLKYAIGTKHMHDRFYAVNKLHPKLPACLFVCLFVLVTRPGVTQKKRTITPISIAVPEIGI